MNVLDRLISYVSPVAGQRRLQARATMQQIESLMGSSGGVYPVARANRLNPKGARVIKENEVPRIEADQLRADSWHLYRTNPAARKIVRTIESKVIGKKGMSPHSQAMRPDGKPDVRFRERARELWDELCCVIDARGLPGRGGQTMSGLQKTALRAVVLSGGCLYRMKNISTDRMKAHGSPVNVALQLVDVCRLADESEIEDELKDGHTVYRGIEFNADGERVAYWLVDAPLWSGATSTSKAYSVSVEALGHLYVEEDIDQPFGTPWFAAALKRTTQTDDLEYNTLMASAMAACVVAAYSKPTGKKRLGLNSANGTGSDLTDEDGNAIEAFQPGMVVDVGTDGKFELQTPHQPSWNPEEFVQHMQRGTATAMPGVKGSTVTGDYKRSSYSSERSADNDAWPEIEGVQDWFGCQYCQPIWETIVRSAVLNGYFDGIVSPSEFQANPSRYCKAEWQGPVALSINPKDDVKAAGDRIRTGLSSPQMECAKTNVNWRDVLNDFAEVYEVAAEKNIPDVVVNQILGVDTDDQLEPVGSATDD